MKYEEIKIGDVFRYQNDKETVIYKNGEYRFVTTIDSEGTPTTFREEELHYLEPLKQQLPEEGLLVSKFGTLAYRLSGSLGYGFSHGQQSCYLFNNKWRFSLDNHWKPATLEQEEEFVEMLKKECERRGLYEDTKIEAHVQGYGEYLNTNHFYPNANLKAIYNKNGQIFYKGKFATPLKEETTLELVSKAVQEIGDFMIEQTESGLIIITPIKSHE